MPALLLRLLREKTRDAPCQHRSGRAV